MTRTIWNNTTTTTSLLTIRAVIMCVTELVGCIDAHQGLCCRAHWSGPKMQNRSMCEKGKYLQKRNPVERFSLVFSYELKVVVHWSRSHWGYARCYKQEAVGRWLGLLFAENVMRQQQSIKLLWSRSRCWVFTSDRTHDPNTCVCVIFSKCLSLPSRLKLNPGVF